MSTLQVTGFDEHIPSCIISITVGGQGGGANSSLKFNEQDD